MSRPDEQLVKVRGDDVFQRDEPVGRDGQEPRQQRRHLDPGKDGLPRVGVGDGDRQAQGEAGDERERMCRVHRQRCQHRVDALLEEPFQPGLLFGHQLLPAQDLDALGRQVRQEPVAEATRVPGRQLARQFQRASPGSAPATSLTPPPPAAPSPSGGSARRCARRRTRPAHWRRSRRTCTAPAAARSGLRPAPGPAERSAASCPRGPGSGRAADPRPASPPAPPAVLPAARGWQPWTWREWPPAGASWPAPVAASRSRSAAAARLAGVGRRGRADSMSLLSPHWPAAKEGRCQIRHPIRASVAD